MYFTGTLYDPLQDGNAQMQATVQGQLNYTYGTLLSTLSSYYTFPYLFSGAIPLEDCNDGEEGSPAMQSLQESQPSNNEADRNDDNQSTFFHVTMI